MAREPRGNAFERGQVMRDDAPLAARHGYGRAGTRGVTPSTQTGVPREVMVTVALVRPADVASMIDVPE